jgi:MFS family permease
MNPFEQAPKSRKILTLAGVYLGVFAMLMMASGLSTILPIAALEIGGIEVYPLASSIGGVFGVAGLPLGAYFGAKYPEKKRPLAALLLVIGAVCVFVWAIAPSMTTIIVAGLFFGVISIAVYGLGFPIIREMFDQVKAGTYLGIVATIIGISMMVSPLIVGALLQTIGWRICFHVTWPLLLISALLIFFGAKATKEQVEYMAVKSGGFDFFGAAAFVIMMAGFILSLSLGGSFVPFGSTLNYVLLALFVIGSVGLIYAIRKKGDRAIIPATTLKDRNVKVLFLCCFFNMAAMVGVFFFIPTYVLYVMGAEPIFAVLPITAYAVMPIILGPVLGRMAGKSGNVRTMHIVGSVVRILVLGTLILVLSPSVPIWLVLILMFAAGFYAVVHTTTVSAGPMIQLKPEIRVYGNSMIQIGQNFGSTVGMAVYTFIMAVFGIAGGLPIAFAFGLVSSVASLISGLFLRKLNSSDPNKTLSSDAAEIPES